jgi:TetR/AcrR family transcriptional repressor of nem operon
MKLSREQAANNRQRIIETAGRLFRLHGFDGVGLADLMKAAGFTHGGFYNHFPSKEALAAEAASSGLNHSSLRLSDTLMDENKTGGSSLTKYVERYLSSKHRDGRESGCTIAALAGDAAREGKEIQERFAQGIEEELEIFASHLVRGSKHGTSSFSARERAIPLLAELVGAIILARAVAEANPSLSEEILRTTRRSLLKKPRTAPAPSRPRKKGHTNQSK